MARRIDAPTLSCATGVAGATRAQLIALLIRIEHTNVGLLHLYDSAYHDAYDAVEAPENVVWDWLFARRFALAERARELRRTLVRPRRDGSVQLGISARIDVEALLRESEEVDAGEAWLLKSAVAPLRFQPASDGGPSPGREASGSRLR